MGRPPVAVDHRRLLEKLGAPVIAADSDGTIIFANRAADDLVGAGPGGLIGSALEKIVPDRFRSPHVRAYGRYTAEGAADGDGAPWPDPVRVMALRADGTEVDVELILSRPDGPGGDAFAVIGVLRDLSAGSPDGSRPALASFLQAIVEASAEAVLAVSPDRRVLAVNRRFRDLWDLPPEVARVGGPSPGLSREQLSKVADPESFEAALAWGHAHPDRGQTLQVPLVDGRIVEGYAAPIIGSGGDYLGRVWFMHDATPRIRAEAQRATLTERLASAERSQRFLLEAADALARTSGLSATLRSLAQVAVPTLGDVCLIDVVGERGAVERVAAVHADPARSELTAQLLRWPPDAAGAHPGVAVMRRGHSMWAAEMSSEFLTATTRDPEHLEVARALGFRGYMAVPLVAGSEVLGAATFVAAGSQRVFGPDDVALAEDLAGRMAVVAAKEGRYDREYHASHTLQANLLPAEVSEVPGLEVAVRYLPGTSGAEVGGDFWDVAVMDGGEAALTIGDVAGHDMAAAAQMAQLRAVLRAMRPASAGPAELVSAVQRIWGHLQLDRLATALLAHLHPGTGRLRLASAGHPPPVMVSPDGQVSMPDLSPGTPLGVPDGHPPTWEGAVPAGGLVVFYTDGLVESPHRQVAEGIAALCSTLGRLGPGPASETADRVLAAMTTDRRSDDVALMVVRRDQP